MIEKAMLAFSRTLSGFVMKSTKEASGRLAELWLHEF